MRTSILKVGNRAHKPKTRGPFPDEAVVFGELWHRFKGPVYVNRFMHRWDGDNGVTVWRTCIDDVKWHINDPTMPKRPGYTGGPDITRRDPAALNRELIVSMRNVDRHSKKGRTDV